MNSFHVVVQLNPPPPLLFTVVKLIETHQAPAADQEMKIYRIVLMFSNYSLYLVCLILGLLSPSSLG